MPLEEDKSLLAPTIHGRINGILRHLDRELSLLERHVEGPGIDSVLYKEINDLPQEGRNHFLSKIQVVRDIITKMKTDLGLQVETENLGRMIWGRCASLQVDIMDLETKRLRGYGEPPEWLYSYLDPFVSELIIALDKMSKSVD